MSNEVVDLKLNGNDGESTKPSVQPVVTEVDGSEGSFRYLTLPMRKRRGFMVR